jgi:hypothetical protein
MKRLVILAVCGALAAPAMAFAADPAVQPTKTSAEAKAEKKNRMVCKQQEEKGSRLGGKRICRTQAEWDEISAIQRRDIDKQLLIAPSNPSQ